MIKKLRKKIIFYTMAISFFLLTIILSTINITNFVMVTNDADHKVNEVYQNREAPSSPVQPGINSAFDYFVYRFNVSDKTQYTVKAFHMRDTNQEKATSWAQSLYGKSGHGWTRRVYRYLTKIDKENNYKYVIVIDQGRELKPSYTILNASIIGGIATLGIVYVVISFISKKMIKPLIDTDRRQKKFIADAALTLKTPVSVISLDNATLTNEHGEELANKSIRKQVDKLMKLSSDLNSLVIINESDAQKERFNLSNILKEIISQYTFAFNDNKKTLQINVQDDIFLEGDVGMIKKMIHECIDNSLKYADTTSVINLSQENERITFEIKNDCHGIPEGSLDRVFDRFYRLDYKDHSIYDGSGVGLSIVKEIVNNHHGRALAKGENDWFILKIEL